VCITHILTRVKVREYGETIKYLREKIQKLFLMNKKGTFPSIFCFFCSFCIFDGFFFTSSDRSTVFDGQTVFPYACAPKMPSSVFVGPAAARTPVRHSHRLINRRDFSNREKRLASSVRALDIRLRRAGSRMPSHSFRTALPARFRCRFSYYFYLLLCTLYRGTVSDEHSPPLRPNV